MPRINLDLNFLDHPKIVSLPPLTQLLFIRSLLYCARHLTDGRFPKTAIGLLAHDLAVASGENLHSVQLSMSEQLIKGGLWDDSGSEIAVHDYLDYQLSRSQVTQLSEKHKKSGRLGGLAKAVANAKRTPSKKLANLYPLTNTNTNIQEEGIGGVTIKDIYTRQAELFWRTYKPNPRKVGKGAVEKWFITHRPTNEVFAQMLARLSLLNESMKWAESGGKWIPGPMTWLNQERWKDDTPVQADIPQMHRSRPTGVVL